MVLHYKEVEFEERLYQKGPAPDFSPEEWMKEKFELGLHFPNVSYTFISVYVDRVLSWFDQFLYSNVVKEFC